MQMLSFIYLCLKFYHMKKIILYCLLSCCLFGCKKDSKTRMYFSASTSNGENFKIKIYDYLTGEVIYEKPIGDTNNDFGERYDLRPKSSIRLLCSTNSKSLNMSIQCSGVILNEYNTFNNKPGTDVYLDVLVPDKN